MVGWKIVFKAKNLSFLYVLLPPQPMPIKIPPRKRIIMKAIAVWQAALSEPHKKMPQYLKTHKLSGREPDGHQHKQLRNFRVQILLPWSSVWKDRCQGSVGMEWVEGSTNNKTMRSGHQVNEFNYSPTTVKSTPALTRSVEPHVECTCMNLFRAFTSESGWLQPQKCLKMFSQNICTTAYDSC